MRTGIYCGSFDPVHMGHVAIMAAALESGYIDKLVVVPTGNYWDKNGLADLEHRVNMLSFVIPDGVYIASDFSEYIWTNELFLAYGKKYGAEELVLILGADNLERFEEWKDYRSLLKYDFYIICRDVYDEEYVRGRMLELGKSNYLISGQRGLPISSSFIRNNLHNVKLLRGYVDDDVLAYIRVNHLYGCLD